MNAMPQALPYGLAIVISGAGLLAFWLLGDLPAASTPNSYVRVVLLIAIAIVTGVLTQFRPPTTERLNPPSTTTAGSRVGTA